MSLVCADSLDDVEVGVCPPQSVGLQVDGEGVRPAQLVCDEGCRHIGAVQTHAADVRTSAPVTPVQEPDSQHPNVRNRLRQEAYLRLSFTKYNQSQS